MRESTPRHFASLGAKGPVKWRDVPGSIGVLESPDKLTPIGQADTNAFDENGKAL